MLFVYVFSAVGVAVTLFFAAAFSLIILDLSENYTGPR